METKAKTKVYWRGDMGIVTMIGSSISKCRLQMALHVPDSEHVLILVGTMDKNGLPLRGSGGIKITWCGRDIQTGTQLSSFYVIANKKR